MSLAALPYWMYRVSNEIETGKLLGAFPSEIYSGSTRSLPDTCYNHHRASFSSYKSGAWDSYLNTLKQSRFDSLIYTENFL